MSKILIFSFAIGLLSSCQGVGRFITEPFRSKTGIADEWKKESGELEEYGAKYNIYETGSPVERTVIYVHGYLGDERIFEMSLQDEVSLKELGRELGPSRIVVVSFGLRWLLTAYPNKQKKPRHATVDTFVDKILPELASRYNFQGPYILVGRSMGGANAATLCFRRPEQWSKCVFMNPMLIPDSTDPFRFFGNDYWKASLLVSSQYESLEQWQEHRPSSLLQNSPSLPPIYITACRLDGLDLFDGAQEWALRAKEMKLNVTWDQVDENCTHQVWPADRIAKFIKQ